MWGGPVVLGPPPLHAPPPEIWYGNALCCPCCPYIGICLCIRPSFSCQVLGGECNGQQGQLGQALQRARLCRVAPLSRRKGDLPAWQNNSEDQDLRCFGVK